jgi:hypothetical protein
MTQNSTVTCDACGITAHAAGPPEGWWALFPEPKEIPDADGTRTPSFARLALDAKALARFTEIPTEALRHTLPQLDAWFNHFMPKALAYAMGDLRIDLCSWKCVGTYAQAVESGYAPGGKKR